jgi:hypothetical protein
MNDLSGTQKFIRMFVSGNNFAAMEAESKTWMLKCPNCNHERSIWDLGGIRYKAASAGKKMYRACVKCGQRGWHTVFKKT